MKDRPQEQCRPYLCEGKASRWLALGAVLLTLTYLGCTNDDAANRKVDYELQERCDIASSRWAKEHSEVIDYRTHYNKRQNACVLYATLAPIKVGDVNTGYFMVYDPNANKTLAQYTVRLGPNFEDRICIVGGKTVDGVTEEKWKGIVKDLMGE